MKLYTIPYAGGFSFTYLKWKKDLETSIDLCPIELPGRSGRAGDELLPTIGRMADFVARKIAADDSGEPYAMFGHSMGAYVVTEAYARLKREGQRLPQHVILSGMVPPHLYQPKGHHLLPEEQFRQRMFELGGIPRQLTEDPEFASFLFRLLRSDFGAVENYLPTVREKLFACPVTLFNSESDHDRSSMNEWDRHTFSPSSYQAFAGSHFFINEHANRVVQAINRILKPSPVSTTHREG
ncbi:MULTISPECIES: thioesterase II family protein [Saccharibacillus]|uniref:thioesterase II family protein n=1 Tax=Saccharibacillus TaxID=456492 RepID=UPI00123C1EDE|nr:alpha/beta fold hydrolase [Saccharibacillus sp. WB 17]MWJ30258.1 hypothetical protein [Saccharibacillus sp. WB 17]